jgi:F0F1-type ATP synthase assembly protein I
VASGLGCSIVVGLVMMIGGGVLLDRWAGTTPLFTLVGVALGLIAAGYQLVRLANQFGSTGAPTPRRPAARRGAKPGRDAAAGRRPAVTRRRPRRDD